MENLLEIIVPIIFAAIYFFGNMLGKSNDEPSAPARRSTDDGEPSAAERQRRIQEEIRRKIMERRQKSDGAPVEAEPRTSPVAPVQRREIYPETPADRPLRERRAQREGRHPHRELEPAAPVAQKSPEKTWTASPNAYEQQMRARLEQIEATKRRAEQLKQQAATSTATTKQADRAHRSKRGRFSGPVRDALRDPSAARAAFIYAEVLGQPISQRKQSAVPGLSN